MESLKKNQYIQSILAAISPKSVAGKMISPRSLWQPIIILSILLTLVIACSSQPTQLAHRADDSGFGGTGIILYSIAEDEGSSGFGGTGIVGNISAFGSIWVNGIEIDYPDDVTIESNLQNTQQQLRLGQTVILETGVSLSSNQLPMTERIRVHYQFAGPIQGVSEAAILINDHRVAITAETLMDESLSLVEGEYLAVNALQHRNGHWHASRLDPNPSKINALQPLPEFSFSESITQVIVDERLDYLREQWHVRGLLKTDMLRRPMMQHPLKPGEHRGPMENMRQMHRDRMDPNAIRFQLHELHSIHHHVRQFPPPPPDDMQQSIPPPQ
jgi:hypothetical protein